MHGGSVKLGRGGGSGGKRNIHIPPINRKSAATSGSRLSSSGGHAAVPRGRDGGGEGASGQSTSIQVDERFSLVTRFPLNFAMALRLVPDLVEEINRVEAMNGTARIKFDSNANNANGNVISVGDKNFNFTWSREMGELCDIYEECKSGEDGSGLLKESGGAWRKLNVQRVLDESTKKHVKMRSEEAERKNKARKSIVLDHQNSTMKSQMKALAAAESSSRMHFKRKELPFKKSKPEPSSGGPPKSVYISGLSTTNPSKGRPSPGSPLASQTKQFGASAYPIVSSNAVKGNAVVPDSTPSQTMNKTASFDKEMTSRLANNTVLDKPKQNSVWQSLALDTSDQLPEQDGITMRTSSNKLEEETNINSMSGHTSETKEKVDIPHNSPDHSNSKNVSDNSEALAGSSSDGESDSGSESNSSDSGSDSGSHSREQRKSPLRSQSGGSTDSGSDESSSSKQAPDEDVDIMTSDDEKEPESMPITSKSPVQLGPQDNKLVDLGNDKKQDYWVSGVVEVENDNPGEHHDTEGAAANYLFSSEEKKERVEEIKPSTTYNFESRETQSNNIVGKDVFKHRYSDGCAKSSKGKSKRSSDDQNSVDRPYNGKRLKGNSMSQPLSGAIENLFGESPQNSSPDGSPESPFRGHMDQMVNRDSSDGNYDPNFQKDFSQGIQTASVSESQLRCERSSGTGIKVEVPFGGKHPSKYGSLGCGVEESERGFKTSESLWMQNGNYIETLHERNKHLKITESIPRKHKNAEKIKDTGRHSKAHTGYSPKDSNTSTMDISPLMNGRGRVLQREVSKLELGEIREPLADEIAGANKHRQPDNKPTNSESWNSDSNRGKSSKRITPESRKLSPQIADAVVSGLPDGSSKRKILENFSIDPSRPHLRETRHLPRQQQSSAVHTEFVSHPNKNGEMSNENRYLEIEKGLVTNLEAYVHKKIHVKETEQKHGSKQTVVSLSMKDIKKQEPNVKYGSKDRRKDVPLNESYDIVQKKTDSSLDEMSSTYTKYEKQEPELKCPIKDISQYNEYVKEYQEKYESYNSLTRILESYSDEFSKLGNDLETYRGRDNKRYQEILGEIKSSFQQCGERHKRLKKIFNVLHEELTHLKQMIKDYAVSHTED